MDNSVTTKKWFRKLFDRYIDTDGKTKEQTYIYVISKKFSDNNHYFKIGVAVRSIQRLNDANTYLSPPIGSDSGFKIHMVIFYPTSPTKGEYSFTAENILHKKLEGIGYRRVPHTTSTRKSEWFLVKDKEHFLEFVKNEIASISPLPRGIYKLEKGQKVADKIELKDIKGHKTDMLKIIRKAARNLLIKTNEESIKRGNGTIFREKLLNLEFKFEKKILVIVYIVYNFKEKYWEIEYQPKSTKDPKTDKRITPIWDILEKIGPSLRRKHKLKITIIG
jgi:hypothetical protein